MDAYMVLRAVVVNQANAAMPVKLLGGAVTVTEANLARDLCMSLEAVQKMIRDFGRNVLKIQDAQDQAERRITML
jgi:hypothetical protein